MTPRDFLAGASTLVALGCTVQRTAAGFACPCHGARYDELGQVSLGPARRTLPWFSLWQALGVLALALVSITAVGLCRGPNWTFYSPWEAWPSGY